MGKKKNKKQEIYPVALTIAGSDSGGGAGIQADLRTFSAFGVYGTSVITAVTSQNPKEVLDVAPMTSSSVESQLRAVSELGIKSVKTGMLFSSKIINTIVKGLTKLDLSLVVDPVMISTSGVKLLEDDAIDTLMEKLLPLASWITPNIPEAELLTETKISNISDMVNVAKKISEKWDCNCVLKGGHLDVTSDEMIDIVVYNGAVYTLSSPLLQDCKATHGTGCTFSAALAATIAFDFDWAESLIAAKSFVFGSLNEAVPIASDVIAMYPPSYSYSDNVTLENYE